MPALTLAALPAAMPAVAHAHLAITGIGPFYDGITHLFVTPQDLLPVIALALWAGLRGPRFGRTVLFALPVACLAGNVIGWCFNSPVTLPAATAAVTVALGVLVAADRPLPFASSAGLAILLGLLNGSLNGMELATRRSSALVTVGAASALFVVVAFIAGHVARVRAPLARLAVRVAGSWIAASGLFMLGWALRRG